MFMGVVECSAAVFFAVAYCRFCCHHFERYLKPDLLLLVLTKVLLYDVVLVQIATAAKITAAIFHFNTTRVEHGLNFVSHVED